MIELSIKVLGQDESPLPWKDRVHCMSLTTGAGSSYLTSWRALHYDCRFRAKYDVNGVRLCQRHLNELAGDLLLSGDSFTVELSGLTVMGAPDADVTIAWPVVPIHG